MSDPPRQDGPLWQVVRLRPGELGGVLLACLYFFCLLASYYLMRSLREEISSADLGNLPVLWTFTFIAMTVAIPIYAWLTSRLPRRLFIPLVYLFFVANILLFWVLLRQGADGAPRSSATIAERVFYVWLSVFNLFAISIFWSFMADLYRTEQGTRLFGLIAVGGSLGGIAGSASASELAPDFGRANLLLVSALLLGLACFCVVALNVMARTRAAVGAARETTERRAPDDSERPIAGNVLQGLLVVFRSPYLLGICVFLFLLTLTNAVLYFEQAEIVGDAFPDRDNRTAFYARIDLWTNGLTLLAQLFLTGRLMSRLGVGVTLVLLPVISVVGFLVLGSSLMLGTGSILVVFVAFQVVHRTSRYALARPAREVLFTVVPRQQKYQSKAFIDTVIYRGGDVASGWLFTTLQAGLGLGLGAIALVAAPVAAVWAAIALLLGRMQSDQARLQTESPAASPDSADPGTR